MSVDSLNIIVFDYKESVIKWLDPELAQIKETTTEDSCRKIELTYPYENEEITEEDRLWYDQGNKVYIPSVNGITSCLYVINTDYTIDFWKENSITVTAEEVLTEMNYDVISFESDDPISITVEQLDTWFGSYYEIESIDTLKVNHNKVSPEGVMTYMSLLRMIEEQTDRKFITRYENEGTHIKRYLNLVNLDTTEYISQTETLDLNYNLDSLEFIKSEEDTYNAMAPIFNNTNTVNVEDLTSATNIGTVTSNIVSNAQNTTSADEDTRSLLQEWLDYSVNEGETVPMIITKDDEGNTVASAYWSAPFIKEAGELYIKYGGTSRANYTYIHPFDETKSPPRVKCGTVSTSETLMPAIYNVLANALLAKIQPDFELKIDVKDIQMLLGDDNLGYQLYESLQVKVPNFNYYVPCRITETIKNLHLPGENSIKIKTDVTSINEILDSEINSFDVIISDFEKNAEVGGILTSNGEPLPNQLVTITVRLKEAYVGSVTGVQQTILTFDPFNNTYVFSAEQIWNLEKALRNDSINEGTDWSNLEHRLRDVTGNVYSVPKDWCFYIYYAFMQLHESNKAHGNDTFEKTITVHYYPNPRELIINSSTFESSKKYYSSLGYDYGLKMRELYNNEYGFELGHNYPLHITYTGDVPYFVMVLYMIFILCNKYTSASKIFDVYSKKEKLCDVLADIYEEFGLDCAIMLFRWDVLQEDLNNNKLVYVECDKNSLTGENIIPTSANNSGVDAYYLLITNWVIINDEKYVSCINPYSDAANPESNNFVSELIPFDVIHNAIDMPFTQIEDMRYYTDSSAVNHGEQPAYLAFSFDEKSIADYEEVQQMIVNTEEFSPSIKTYKFSIDTIRNTIIELMKLLASSDVYLMSASTSMNSTDNTSYENVGMWWLRAMSYAFMFYYRTHEGQSTNMTINAGINEDSGKYYSHFDTAVGVIGNYDWFSPCYPQNKNNRLGYICSTLLFNLGIAYSPYDFVSSNSYDNFTDIAQLITGKAGDGTINYFIVDATETNIKKYLGNVYHDEFMKTVILTYAYSSDLNNTAYFNQTNYPVMLYGVNSNTVRYMNILANGNSPTNRYNTPQSSSGDYNPYGEVSVSSIVSWINNVSSQLGGGDGNKMLVISWNTRTELGG